MNLYPRVTFSRFPMTVFHSYAAAINGRSGPVCAEIAAMRFPRAGNVRVLSKKVSPDSRIGWLMMMFRSTVCWRKSPLLSNNSSVKVAFHAH